MIAKQSVFLTADQKAVPEGHADAKFLLVREGNEIEEALVEKHDALSLVNSASKKKAEPEQEITPPVFKDHSATSDAPVEGKTPKPKKPAKGKK